MPHDPTPKPLPPIRLPAGELREILEAGTATPGSEGSDALSRDVRAAAERTLVDLRESHADDPPPELLARTVADMIARDRERAESTHAKPQVHSVPWWGELVSLVMDAARGVVDASRMVAAKLVVDTRADLAPAGFRSASAGDDVHVAYECAFARIDIVAVRQDEGTSWRVRGQVTSDDAEVTAIAIAPASFAASGETVFSTIPADGGFEHTLSPQAYMVAIEFDDGAKNVLVSLDLRGDAERGDVVPRPNDLPSGR